jgi:hypothetical protein
MKIIFSEKRIINWLFIITTFLTFLNIFFQVLKYFFGLGRVFGLVDFFNMDIEANPPTLFSVFLLLLSAAILFIIFKVLYGKKKKNKFYWLGLSIFFIIIGIDESVSVHERISGLLEKWLNPSGIFYYGTVIIGLLFIPIIIIFSIVFLKSLPSKIRTWFIIAGTIYISGALGMEMIGGWYFEIHNYNFIYQVISTIEEVLEMIGIIVFIKTLLQYLKLILSEYNNILKIEII